MTDLYDVTGRIILVRPLKLEVNTRCLQFMKMDMVSRKQWIVSNQRLSANSVVIEDLRILSELHILKGPKQLCPFRFKNARKYLTDASQNNSNLFLHLKFRLCDSGTCPHQKKTLPLLVLLPIQANTLQRQNSSSSKILR